MSFEFVRLIGYALTALVIFMGVIKTCTLLYIIFKPKSRFTTDDFYSGYKMRNPKDKFTGFK